MVWAAREGSETQGHHFAAVLLLQLESRFQSVRIGLVDLVGEIVFHNPAARGGDLQLRIPRRNLFDGYQNFHT